MYERLLVPLDGSKLAEAALPYAEELAGMFDSELLLLEVCEPDQMEFSHMCQLYIEQMGKLAKQHIEEYYKKEGAKVGTTVTSGEPAEEIVAYSKKNDISLVVATTHARSGITSWAMGTVANRLLREIRAPIVLIRPTIPQVEAGMRRLLGKILVPLDGSDAGAASLPHVEGLAVRLKADIILLQVIELGRHVHTVGGLDYVPYPEPVVESLKGKARDYLEKIGTTLRGRGCVVRSEVRVGESAQQIIRVADEIGAHLVVMSTHGRSGIKKWAFGSVTDKVLQAGHTPIMLVRTSYSPSTTPQS
jgi:nucleotide-binding universal stress UspA family protein